MYRSPSLAAWCLVLLIAAPVVASGSGFYVPGVGVRASSGGGAFVGLADDYSAVHWNPAGITQIEGMEVTVTGHDGVPMASRDGTLWFTGTLDSDVPVGEVIGATSEVEHHLAPGVFLYADLKPLRAVFDKLGICAYTLSDYGATWDGGDVYDDLIDGYATLPTDPAGYRRVMGDPPDSESRIKGYVISPVVAKEIVPGLSVGLAGHALYSHFYLKDGGWHEESAEDSSWLHPYEMEDDLTGWAFGATFGVLYRANENVSAGIAVRTPMTVSLEGNTETRSTYEDLVSASQTETFDLTFPMWAGIGFAYRDFVFDGMTLTGDLHWTQWSSVDEIAREVDNELPEGLGTTPLDWYYTLEVRVGLDYRMSRALSVRLGYRNEPDPAPDETYDFAMPQITQNVVTFGLGYRQDVWRADFSLEYAAGDTRELEWDVNRDMFGDHLLDLMVPSLSFTYSF
jgi:long-chain fatty acid transport protein